MKHIRSIDKLQIGTRIEGEGPRALHGVGFEAHVTMADGSKQMFRSARNEPATKDTRLSMAHLLRLVATDIERMGE
jgi:hypothetical protein